MKKSRSVRLGNFTLRFAPPPPPLPQPVSSPEARAAVEAFCTHVKELSERSVEMIEVSEAGIRFRSRRGKFKPGVVCADLGLLDTKATSENVAAVFAQGRSRTDLEHMFDAVRAGDLFEAKFRANMISGAVYTVVS
ncbi:hypothetical protein IB276_05920 [Ensifer sp. ENS04]|uniref:hypothetical protein n=1 Tax=Ensifer sp. ENS04 TaxID=2769281 RepID=UPI0017855C5F|nr:hypothetical protein [Ensifer sp. ENS04]MBD9538977.1 hypothetical protein [Ensifer sp. ENS04]